MSSKDVELRCPTFDQSSLMVKRFLQKILQFPLRSCVAYALWLLAILHLLQVYNPYDYGPMPREAIKYELHIATIPDLVVKENTPKCNYDDILESKVMLNWPIKTISEHFAYDYIVNGSFSPNHCNPLFSVAILVVYRNRPNHIKTFLPYMHMFLRKQNIHYKIFVIEQQDDKQFNRGLLFNIGARVAIAERFPCLILHDVDLLPLDAANLYACLRSPRHMSASIDKFRFVLPYDYINGGVLAIRADQYQQVNGFSNKFEGWGGEDDDFSGRLKKNNLTVCRWPMDMSRYTMLPHRQATMNADRKRIMAENRRKGVVEGDGLDSARYDSLRVIPQQLDTLLAVQL